MATVTKNSASSLANGTTVTDIATCHLLEIATVTENSASSLASVITVTQNGMCRVYVGHMSSVRMRLIGLLKIFDSYRDAHMEPRKSDDSYTL